MPISSATERRTRPVATGAGRIGLLAIGALAREVGLTPKPGLVDRRNCGAHRDMDLATFRASIRAIGPFFAGFCALGVREAGLPPRAFLSLLRAEGRACEAAMFAATAGVNTHKGAVFALGLLAAAAGRLEGRGDTATVTALCAECTAMTAHLVADELRRPLAPRTAGERLFQRHGMTGARGEAASGFATARRHALPAFRRARAAGLSTPFALHAAFLELLAENADTNLVSRGGIEGLEFVRAEARALRAAGGITRADFLPRMEALDDELNRRNLSPGGSADLLSVTWFLSHFAEEKNPASSQAAGSTEGGGEQT